MQKQLAIVIFPGLDLTKEIVEVAGCTPPASTTGNTLPSTNCQFFIAPDINGINSLCAVKTTDPNSKLTLVWSDGATPPVTTPIDAVLAPPTVEVDFVGGRPIVVR